MAGEMQLDYLTGQTVYFLLRNSVSLIWDGASFVNYSGGNYSAYLISGAEQGSGGFYTADMPSVIAGVYSIVGKQQAGGSPAETDFSVGWGTMAWNGSAVPPPAFSGQSVSLLSGQSVTVASGQLSGQPITLLSGFSYQASGINVVVPPSSLSGVSVTASVTSGDVYLASGQVSVDIPYHILRSDVSGFQSGAGKQSLLGAILKQTSKFDVGSGGSGNAIVYETDGVTPFMTQTKTTNTLLKPTQTLDVGQ